MSIALSEQNPITSAIYIGVVVKDRATGFESRFTYSSSSSKIVPTLRIIFELGSTSTEAFVVIYLLGS